MALEWSNVAVSSELASSITDIDETIPLTTVEGWSDGPAVARITSGGDMEVVRYDSLVGSDLTGVTRDADGDTPAQSWGAGATVEHVVSAGALAEGGNGIDPAQAAWLGAGSAILYHDFSMMDDGEAPEILDSGHAPIYEPDRLNWSVQDGMLQCDTDGQMILPNVGHDEMRVVMSNPGVGKIYLEWIDIDNNVYLEQESNDRIRLYETDTGTVDDLQVTGTGAATRSAHSYVHYTRVDWASRYAIVVGGPPGTQAMVSGTTSSGWVTGHNNPAAFGHDGGSNQGYLAVWLR